MAFKYMNVLREKTHLWLPESAQLVLDKWLQAKAVVLVDTLLVVCGAVV